MTAGGSEVFEHLLLAHALCLKLRVNLLRKAVKDLATNLTGSSGAIPGEKEARRGSVACYHDHFLGAEHLARAISKARIDWVCGRW